MLKRQFQNVLALLLLVSGMVACTPGSELSLPAEADANTTNTTAGQPPDGMNTTTITETKPTGETALETVTQDSPVADVIVDVTPMSEEELANQPPGTAPSGAGGSQPGGGSDAAPKAVDDPEISLEGGSGYTDPTYQFSIEHPADFVVRSLDSAKLAEFTPVPLAAIRFMSPAIANSDLGDLDIPELSVRVFPAPQDGSLESWLAASGLTIEGDG
jgi:hypothetical protein